MSLHIFLRHYQQLQVAYDLKYITIIPGTDLAPSEAKKNLGMYENFLSMNDY